MRADTLSSCRFCGRKIRGAGYARTSHEAADVRKGIAVRVWRWTWKGEHMPMTGRVIANTPEALAVAAQQDLFPTFDLCKQYYNSQPVEA